ERVAGGPAARSSRARRPWQDRLGAPQSRAGARTRTRRPPPEGSRSSVAGRQSPTWRSERGRARAAQRVQPGLAPPLASLRGSAVRLSLRRVYSVLTTILVTDRLHDRR